MLAGSPAVYISVQVLARSVGCDPTDGSVIGASWCSCGRRGASGDSRAASSLMAVWGAEGFPGRVVGSL